MRFVVSIWTFNYIINELGMTSKPRCSNVCRSFRNNTVTHNSRNLRKVLSSKRLFQPGHSDGKSCSTGIIFNQDKQTHSKPKQTTKSDLLFNKNAQKCYRISKPCNQCGDTVDNFKSGMERTVENLIQRLDNDEGKDSKGIPELRHKNLPTKINCETIQQYYKNENFGHSSESVHASYSQNKAKPSLSTINEKNESISDLDSLKDIIYEIYPEKTSEEMGYYDTEKNSNIEQIREFRQNNYFECHSAKSRIAIKGSTSTLGEHKCVYRFYLNERLFPVPLNTDHHNNIRCVDCHLPVQKAKQTCSINGTIQAKVRLGDDTQDTIIMLPVKKPLIIKERRKELKNIVNPEILYFGVIKLNSNGDSMFNSTRPSNSLALKYQKGYKEFENIPCYKYDHIEDGDVIII